MSGGLRLTWQSKSVRHSAGPGKVTVSGGPATR
jgi:hypothetical protein